MLVTDNYNFGNNCNIYEIGVGISGEEGLQAARASDYAIAQFRYLNYFGLKIINCLTTVYIFKEIVTCARTLVVSKNIKNYFILVLPESFTLFYSILVRFLQWILRTGLLFL